MTQVTILDKELEPLAELLRISALKVANQPRLAHLCYRLGQRVEARLHEITSSTPSP